MPVVHFLAATVQVPQGGREVDAGGIHQLLFRQIESGADGQQLSANRACLRIELAGLQQRLDEIRHKQHVWIERQNPLGLRQRDRLILRRGKTDIFAIVIDAASIGKLLQNVGGPVRGRVVDDDNLKILVFLLKHRLEAPLYESSAVKSDYRDRYRVFKGHPSL